jgi:hypothetical protein
MGKSEAAQNWLAGWLLLTVLTVLVNFTVIGAQAYKRHEQVQARNKVVRLLQTGHKVNVRPIVTSVRG